MAEKRGDDYDSSHTGGTLEVAHNEAPKSGSMSTASPVIASSKAPGATAGAFETPEWNAEMDARETERYHAYQPPRSDAVNEGGVQAYAVPGDEATQDNNSASELAGIARKPRKPLPAYELDGRERKAELSANEGGTNIDHNNRSAQ
jgi:hypothetical protein